MKELAKKVISGDLLAASKLMRAVDDEMEGSDEALSLIYPHTGNAYIIGITGNPGSGKSTIIDGLIEIYRKEGHRVGIVAVDPTSPISQGAILGDRIRMQKHFLDHGVFIRSLATRGMLGGISPSTYKIAQIMDAVGFSRIFIETVGVGQDEIDVVKVADTTIVVFAPGFGDDIQAIKAGIIEFADIIVVNKADREDWDKTFYYFKSLFDTFLPPLKWKVPIIKTIATEKEGIEKLKCEIEEHKKFVENNALLQEKRNKREKELFKTAVKEKIYKIVDSEIEERFYNSEIYKKMIMRELSPFEVADFFIKDFSKKIWERNQEKRKKKKIKINL